MPEYRARPWQPSDDLALREIAKRAAVAQGQPGADVYPDPRQPLVVGAGVIEDEHGRIVACVMGKVMVEALTVLDPDFGTPRDRWEALQKLYALCCVDLRQRGFRWLYAPVPAALERYGRRLVKELGFRRDDRIHHYLDIHREGVPTHEEQAKRRVEAGVAPSAPAVEEPQ